MPIFISYSRSDSEFVDRLAMQLVGRNARIWLDKWELNVGDSLLDRIQEAVQGASALVVVLSQASVASEWCRREINGGLIRELDEKRVVVMPVLLEDCEVPIFLRDKLFADFRTNYDEGFETLMQSIAAVVTSSLGRVEAPEFHLDWSIDWGEYDDGCLRFHLTFIEHAVNQPYTCLATITVAADHQGTASYYEQRARDGGDVARLKIVGLLARHAQSDERFRLRLSDQFEKRIEVDIQDEEGDVNYRVLVSARRLGQDTGRDILLDVSGQIENIRNQMADVLRRA